MQIKQPYDDDKLIYNATRQQYELKREYVKANFEITFNDDGVLDKRISLNSNVIYQFIYRTGYSGNRKIVQWFINNTEEGREYIHDALFEQMGADLMSGINDLGKVPAINVKTGIAIDPQALAFAQISLNARNILENSMGYLGVNLLYQAKYSGNIILFYQGNV